MRSHAASFLLLGLFAASACKTPPPASPHDPPPACTEEARVCADGSTVVRTGPKCEFQRCPGDPDNGVSPDPSAAGPNGASAPQPMGTFNPESPPS